MSLKTDEWVRIMDDFIIYCGRYDPTFPQRIVAASDADIDRVEELAGLPLPPEYRVFLAAMGRTPADSLGNFLKDVNYGIEAVWQFYTDPPTPVPNDAVYLWTLDFDYEMFLPVAGGEHEKRPIVQFGWPRDQEAGELIPQGRRVVVVANSLLHYLYKEAFLRLREPLLAYHTVLKEKLQTQKPDENYTQQRRAQFRMIAERLGFNPVPYMDNDLVFYDRGDAALELFSEQVAEDTVYVDADDERECARLCEILSDNLDLKRG